VFIEILFATRSNTARRGTPRAYQLGTLGFFAAVAACASAPKTGASGESCGLRLRDSTFAAVGPVYRDCAVDRAAKLLTTDIRPDFRPTAARTACYSVDVEFVVDEAGRPEGGTARVIRTSEQAYADAVLATLNRWKYEPAVKQGAAVRQIVAEHRAMASQVVVAPAGGGRPSRSTTPPPPKC